MKRYSPTARHRILYLQLGFTLIELLIALGVMAIFALMAYRGLDSVLRLHQGAHSHEVQAQAIDAVITQFEADVRQSSKVTASLLSSADAEPNVKIEIARRIDGQASTVRWEWAGNQLSRRVLAAQERPEQTAMLLANVTNLAWLIHLPEQEGKPAQWQPIATAAVLAQPTQSVSIARGIGLRLTVAGRPIEKVFLMGR